MQKRKYFRDDTKDDLIRAFFVENNKPISVLPSNPETRLSFKLDNNKSNDILFADANKLQRKSSNDFNVMKLEGNNKFHNICSF